MRPLFASSKRTMVVTSFQVWSPDELKGSGDSPCRMAACRCPPLASRQATAKGLRVGLTAATSLCENNEPGPLLDPGSTDCVDLETRARQHIQAQSSPGPVKLTRAVAFACVMRITIALPPFCLAVRLRIIPVNSCVSRNLGSASLRRATPEYEYHADNRMSRGQGYC